MSGSRLLSGLLTAGLAATFLVAVVFLTPTAFCREDWGSELRDWAIFLVSIKVCAGAMCWCHILPLLRAWQQPWLRASAAMEGVSSEPRAHA